MIEIKSLKAQPANVKSGINNEVKFSWRASIDNDNDNPVQIDLSIEDDNPVYFLDIESNKVKTVTWETSATEKSEKPFSETLYLVVSPNPDEPGETLVAMTATDNNKNDPSVSHCVIKYQM